MSLVPVVPDAPLEPCTSRDWVFQHLLGFCLFKLDFTSFSSGQNLNPHFHEPHPESCMQFCICNFILFFKNYSLTELCQFNAPRNRNKLLNLINKTSLLWFSVNSFVKDKKSFLNAAKILWLDYSPFMFHLFLQPLGNGSFCSNFHWDRKKVPLISNKEIWEGSDQENWELEGISGKILPVITPLE